MASGGKAPDMAHLDLSVVIAGEAAPPSAFVVWRGFETAIAKAADCGYQGVELALRAADEVATSALSKWLSRNNMRVSSISTGQVRAVSGLTLADPDVAVRRRAVEVLAGLIHLARDFGGLVNIGRVRGDLPADPAERPAAEARFLDALREVCDVAAGENVGILLEPVNRYETNFLNRVEEAAAMATRAGRANLRLMPDTFHMNIEDVQIGEALVRHARLLGYIHLADSNRQAPGRGHLDFDDVFAGLSRAGYSGWAAAEILPVPDADTAARVAAEWLLPRIARYNNSTGVLV
jgi:sugar phosphate isomerase/epimerase